MRISSLLYIIALSAFGQTPNAVTGSGFFFSADGYLVTNYHVIKGCNSATFKVRGVRQSAQVVFSDAKNDVAVLKAELPQAFLSFRDDQRVRLGESIIAAGYPLADVMASSLNLTTGSVSALAGLGDDTRMIQFSAPVQSGSSGGPLLDQSGHVVGIVTSKLSSVWAASNVGDIPQNVNFAIKASVVRDFLDSRAIDYRTERSASILATTTVAETVGDAVVSISCAPDGNPAAGGVVKLSKPITGTSDPGLIQRISDVKTIFIGEFGTTEAAALVKEKLSNRLVKSGKLTIIEDERQADAVLTGVVGNNAIGVATVAVVKVVTRERRVIWGGEKTAGGISRFVAVEGGASASIADKLAADLLKAIEEDRKGK